MVTRAGQGRGASSLLAAFATGLGLLLSGCGDDAPPPDDAPLATQATAGEIPGARLELDGVIRYRSGCLLLDRGDGKLPWIVWPPGAVRSGDGGVLVAGERYGPLDEVRAVGTVAVLADLPGGARADSYFGAPGKQCDADAAGVVVLDSIVPTAG